MTTPNKFAIREHSTGHGRIYSGVAGGRNYMLRWEETSWQRFRRLLPERVRTLRAYFRRERIPSMIPHPRFEDRPSLTASAFSTMDIDRNSRSAGRKSAA
jgi:hypothetical protein